MSIFRTTTTAALAATVLVGTALATASLTTPASAEQDHPTARKAGAYKVTLKASESEVVATKKVVLKGKVKPATKGGAVRIEKKLDGKKWKLEKLTTMNKKGKFSYTDKPTTAGVRHYRVVVPKNGKHAKGKSKTVGLTVFRWRNLTELPVRRNDSTYQTRVATINAKDYPRAFIGQPYPADGYVDWNLKRSCTTLTARVGMDDGADESATAHIELIADGAAEYSGDFGLTESTKVSLDLTDVFRFGFTWTASNPQAGENDGVGARAAIADGRILCAF